MINKNEAHEGYYAVKVIKGCEGCEYKKNNSEYCLNFTNRNCSVNTREDGENVIFKKIEKDYEEILKLETGEIFGEKLFKISTCSKTNIIFFDEQILGIKLNSVYNCEKYDMKRIKESIERYNKKHGKIPTFEEEYAKCEKVEYKKDDFNYYIHYNYKTNSFDCGALRNIKHIGLKYISIEDCKRIIKMSKKYNWKL